MNNGKGNMILLTIIAVATLLVAVIGATFAYFSATMNGNQSETPIEVTSGTLSIEYDGDSKINIQSPVANPLDTLSSKTFNVTGVVTGSNNLNYDASLVITNNSFGDGELKYTITSTNVSDNGTTFTSTSEPIDIPAGTNTIALGKGVFAGPVLNGAFHNYVLSIITSTGDLANKNFEAHLNVTQTKN